MKTTIAIIVLALFCGCNRASPQKWEYTEFEFLAPVELTILLGQDKKDKETPANVEQVLNAIGQYGWELAWTDHQNFIVKRPAGIWKDGGFFVIHDYTKTDGR
ncbi:MAG: hypothetical protein WBN75_21640 [Verrucomicrobiia bacterium]